MSELPRELFVPDSARGFAYVDEDVPLGGGRYLIEPLTTALLLQAGRDPSRRCRARCRLRHRLHIGDRSARMASAVVALESDPELATRAGTLRSHKLGLNTATVVIGPLREGWHAQAPYDVIVFQRSCLGCSSRPSRNSLAKAVAWSP